MIRHASQPRSAHTYPPLPLPAPQLTAAQQRSAPGPGRPPKLGVPPGRCPAPAACPPAVRQAGVGRGGGDGTGGRHASARAGLARCLTTRLPARPPARPRTRRLSSLTCQINGAGGAAGRVAAAAGVGCAAPGGSAGTGAIAAARAQPTLPCPAHVVVTDAQLCQLGELEHHIGLRCRGGGQQAKRVQVMGGRKRAVHARDLWLPAAHPTTRAPAVTTTPRRAAPARPPCCASCAQDRHRGVGRRSNG